MPPEARLPSGPVHSRNGTSDLGSKELALCSTLGPSELGHATSLSFTASPRKWPKAGDCAGWEPQGWASGRPVLCPSAVRALQPGWWPVDTSSLLQAKTEDPGMVGKVHSPAEPLCSWCRKDAAGPALSLLRPRTAGRAFSASFLARMSKYFSYQNVHFQQIVQRGKSHRMQKRKKKSCVYILENNHLEKATFLAMEAKGSLMHTCDFRHRNPPTQRAVPLTPRQTALTVILNYSLGD